MKPINLLRISNTDWFDVALGGVLYGTRMSVNTSTQFDITNHDTQIIWLKHHGDCLRKPVSTIYDGTVLDCIPVDWVPLINQKRIHIVIDTMEESWGPVYDNTINHVESANLHLSLASNARRRGIDCKQITWLTGDMNAEEYCNHSEINVKSFCMFMWSFVNIVSTSINNAVHFARNHNTAPSNFLICPNRFPKAHRGYTVSRLKKMQEQNSADAFSNICFSFPKEISGLPASTIIDAFGKLKSRKDNWPDYFDRNNTFDWHDIKKHMYELHDTLPRKLDDVDFNTDYCAGADSISSIRSHYHNSAFCLVTETWAEGRKLFISDAVLASILHSTPFLIVGCRGSLSLLRSKGFKTFGNIIDESYDDIEDDAERWDAVLTQVEHLGKIHHSHIITDHLKETLDYNLKHLFDIAPIEENIFAKYINYIST